MTRDEYDRRYAATQDTTDGYTDEELEQINDAVFAEVAALDLDPWGPMGDQVQNVMDRVMNSWPHDGSQKP